MQKRSFTEASGRTVVPKGLGTGVALGPSIAAPRPSNSHSMLRFRHQIVVGRNVPNALPLGGAAAALMDWQLNLESALDLATATLHQEVIMQVYV